MITINQRAQKKERGGGGRGVETLEKAPAALEAIVRRAYL